MAMVSFAIFTDYCHIFWLIALDAKYLFVMIIKIILLNLQTVAMAGE